MTRRKVLIALTLLALVMFAGLLLQTRTKRVPAIERQLEKLQVEVYPSLQLCENSELYAKTSVSGLLRESSARVTLDETEWICTRMLAPERAYGGTVGEYDYAFLLENAPRVQDAKVSLVFDFGAWSPDNHLLIPRENRSAAVTDALRLHGGESPVRVEFVGDSLTVSAVGILFREAGKGLWLVADPRTAKGKPGIRFEESEDRTTARLTFDLASPREPTEGAVPQWNKGDATQMRFLALVFDCDSPDGMMEKFTEARNHYVR